jgi:hypothetical protein
MQLLVIVILLLSVPQLVRCFNYPSLGSVFRRPVTSLKASSLELSEDNVLLVLDEMRLELGTIFGYNNQSRAVGITGKSRVY